MELIYLISSNAMVFLTAITTLLLWYYTKETYLLRLESEKQTRIQFMPYLALRNLDDGATIFNLGKGIALNIEFDGKRAEHTNDLLVIPSIGSNENRCVYKMNDESTGAWTVFARDLPEKVVVKYGDTLGKKYEAIFQRKYKGMGVFEEVIQREIA